MHIGAIHFAVVLGFVGSCSDERTPSEVALETSPEVGAETLDLTPDTLTPPEVEVPADFGAPCVGKCGTCTKPPQVLFSELWVVSACMRL